ncbi:MAG TPA: ABC transporter permease [Alphaproteobacteria bacterium]|nr:ABC transporter permease [Alphaproteobacteria bacterium]
MSSISPTVSAPRPAALAFETGGRPTAKAALGDLGRALAEWELWLTMAWQDIKQRYRGSMLGPFWVTISMGVQVGAWSIVFGQLFGTELSEYIPYLTLGSLVWSWMAAVINESTQLFVFAQRYVKQIRLPITLFIFRLLSRNLIVLGHNFVVYIIVALIFGLNPGWRGLLAIPGLMLGILSLFWIALFFGMLGARFRDFPQIVASLITVMFLLTPILWEPAQLGGHRYFVVDYNPVYYFIEIVREPLMGRSPPIGFWKVTALITAVITAIVFPAFRRFRSRIAYWV